MPVLEIAEFSLAPQATEESFLAARPAMEAWLRRQPGFVSLRLVRDGARWMDICEWQDMAAARSAAATFMEDPGTAAFIATLDGSTATMRHLEVVARA